MVQISALLVGGAIIKFTFALLLIMIVPAVTNLVEDQHSHSVDSIESVAVSQELPNPLFKKAHNTTSSIPAEIASNGESFVITPDGRVSELIVNRYLDIYTATSILSTGFLLPVQEKEKFELKTTDDAAILNVSYHNEYSPHDNVSINVTVESYAPRSIIQHISTRVLTILNRSS